MAGKVGMLAQAGHLLKVTASNMRNRIGKMVTAPHAHGSKKLANSLYQFGPSNSMVRKVGKVGMYSVGAAAMTGVAVMNGGMAAANQNMTARYMRDSRYSSKLLQNRIGSGRNQSAMNIGNHTGLSLSLSSSRHGR